MISLPPLQKHERLPYPACHSRNAAGIASFPAYLQSSYQEPWARPFTQAGVERREQTCFNSLLPPSSPSLLLWMEGRKARAKERWKNACQESADERAEADFDVKSGRERDRKQDQADRKVAGFLGAFCRHHQSVSALNLIISTRATD